MYMAYREKMVQGKTLKVVSLHNSDNWHSNSVSDYSSLPCLDAESTYTWNISVLKARS